MKSWVTFGIIPTFPHDGFGYIQISKNRINNNNVSHPVKNFIEKPSKSEAEKFLKK